MLSPFVSGIPIHREIRDLKAEIPKNLQIENPPKFIWTPSLIDLRHLACLICATAQSGTNGIGSFLFHFDLFRPQRPYTLHNATA